MNLAVQLYSNAPSNPLSVPGVWPANVVELGDGTTLPDGTYQLMTLDDFINYKSIYQSTYDTWYLAYMASLPANQAAALNVSVSSLPAAQPFATPTYRNKHDAVPAPVTCPDNTATAIDYQIAATEYTYGGEIIVQGAEFGDWLSAEIYDKDSIIPSFARSALCEAWPSVAKYIIKKYLPVEEAGETVSAIIDTRPLIAQIPAGLYLRVTYNAIAATDAPDRKAIVNYFLLKALP
jgi:hypothetical protein